MAHRSFVQSAAGAKHAALELETIAAMSEAFEAACQELDDIGQPELVLEVIADRIIAAARGGEGDPVRFAGSRAWWIRRTRLTRGGEMRLA